MKGCTCTCTCTYVPALHKVNGTISFFFQFSLYCEKNGFSRKCVVQIEDDRYLCKAKQFFAIIVTRKKTFLCLPLVLQVFRTVMWAEYILEISLWVKSKMATWARSN